MSNQYLSFDVTKQSAPQQLITGRQGDSQLKFVTMLFWDGDKNVPYDLTGKKVAFEALKPDNTHIVDYEGITVLDAPAGLVRYSFNEQVFAVAGKMQQAFFKITHTDKNDQVISDSTLEINIHILENRVEFGINSTDYLSEYDDLIAQVKQKFADYAATVQDSIDKANALHDQIVEYINLINAKGVVLISEFGDAKGIKQPVGANFVEKLNNEFDQRGINVKWFGAVGDGVTDDTAAFKAALSYDSRGGNFIYIPLGTYVLSEKLHLTKNIKAERGAKLLNIHQGLAYLFVVDKTDVTNLVISGLTVDMQDGRGVINCTNLDYVEITDCDFRGYSAKYDYYKTDSAIMLDNVVEAHIKDVRIHDHGNQYDTELATLNRCITLQGSNKLAKFENLTIERANQGVVIECPDITVMFNNSYFTETHDNSIYSLNAKLVSFNHVIFDEKFDESSVISGGMYIYNDCTFLNPVSGLIVINGDTQMVNIKDCNFIGANGYGGSPINFRNLDYRINSLVYANNRLNIYPNDTTSDVFTLGQIDYFDISDNLIKVSALGKGQRVFSFRNTQNVLLRGKLMHNTVVPLTTADTIDSDYYFADFFKDNKQVYVDSNDTMGGRISLYPGITFNNSSAQVNIGPYATGIEKAKTRVYSDSMPLTGTWHVGDIVWNTNPSKDKNNICWFRITDGSSNQSKTDWLAVYGE